MVAAQRSLLLQASAVFQLPSGFTPSYNTSGFRADASLFHSTIFRSGILAALRALKTRSVIGLVITTSHNQVSNNGVKIVDPSGHMLAQAWDPFADSLVAADRLDGVVVLIIEFVEFEGIEIGGARVEVLVGRVAQWIVFAFGF